MYIASHRYDLEDAFGKYGPVKNVWVARRPPGFGFVEMEDRQDAEEAVRLFLKVFFSRCRWKVFQVRMLDGAKIVGTRIKVRVVYNCIA